jgi:putative membrane protein
MYNGHGYGAWFGGGFMWIFLILLIVVVVWLVKAAMSSGDASRAQDGNDSREKTPLELLEERFVRGEIDEEEFEHKRKLLRG